MLVGPDIGQYPLAIRTGVEGAPINSGARRHLGHGAGWQCAVPIGGQGHRAVGAKRRAVDCHAICVPDQVQPGTCPQFRQHQRQTEPGRQPMPDTDQYGRAAHFIGLRRIVQSRQHLDRTATQNLQQHSRGGAVGPVVGLGIKRRKTRVPARQHKSVQTARHAQRHGVAVA